MKVWITRDADDTDDTMLSSGNKPELQTGGWFMPENGEDMYYDCASDFKKDFGFTPRKGSCKQYELSLREIK